MPLQTLPLRVLGGLRIAAQIIHPTSLSSPSVFARCIRNVPLRGLSLVGMGCFLFVSSLMAYGQSAQSQPPPKMRLCVGICETLTWANDHYEGVRDGGNAVTTLYTVARWQPDGIELHGTSVKNVDRTPFHLTGTFTGRPQPGGSVADAKTAWRIGLKSGTNSFQLTWQPAPPPQITVAAAAAAPSSAAIPIPQAPADVPAASIPAALLECDGAQQCAHGGVGAWVFNGTSGQATWTYGAIAVLTVTQFDGRTIAIHREDPRGSYSSHYSDPSKRPDSTFFADYVGTIHGNRIEGSVSWNGGAPGGAWYAVIPQHLCHPASDCPADMATIMHLGAVALEAKRYPEALLCYRIGSANGNADAQGIAGGMILVGQGAPANPSDAIPFLQASVERNDYFGMYSVSKMFELGLGTAPDPQKAAYWKDRADHRKAELDRADLERRQKDAAALVALGAIIVGGMLDDPPPMTSAEQREKQSDEAMHRAEKLRAWNDTLERARAGEPD